MSIFEARSIAPPTQEISLFQRVWPLAFIGLAGLLTLAWIGFCGYGAVELIMLLI